MLPNPTSNLHSEPFDKITCVGGAGACCLSAVVWVRSKPGSDIALLLKGIRDESWQPGKRAKISPIAMAETSVFGLFASDSYR